MANKVVHLSDEIHGRAKQYCQERKITMSQWITDLIKEAVPKKIGATPVLQGKRLPSLDGGNGEDVASKGPFWNGDQAS